MSESILFICPLCAHKVQLPSKYVGQQGKCPGCSEKVTVVDSGVRDEIAVAQESKSASGTYEPASDGTFLLHRISETIPDSPLSHLTFVPGTFDHDGSPYYLLTDDGECGFVVFEAESEIDGNDQILLVCYMDLDISYGDVSQVYDGFTLLQDNGAYHCSSSWVISSDGDLGLKTSLAILPLMEMSTLDLQLHVNQTIQLFCGRAVEFFNTLANENEEVESSSESGEVLGKIIEMGLKVGLKALLG